MSRDNNSRSEALKADGALNAHPERVDDPLFDDCEFFDPRDLVQVKYEMLRCVRVDGATISEAAGRFGVSRPTYYRAAQDFDSGGLAGLIPRKRGPRQGHKLTDAILAELELLRDDDPTLDAVTLAAHVMREHGIEVHPRSVERALDRRKKKRPGPR